MLSTLDPTKDNLADNEEVQELYRSYMSLRPKIVKLIDEYSQKRGMLSLCTHQVLYGTNDFVFLCSSPRVDGRELCQSAQII